MKISRMCVYFDVDLFFASKPSKSMERIAWELIDIQLLTWETRIHLCV